MDGMIGRPTIRIDGPAKVTGRALYASDETVPHPAYAFLVTSAIARGRVAGMDLSAAQAVPGVLDVLTHGNVGGQAKTPKQATGGPTTTTLESDQVWHDGQIIGVVVADTFEAAREAAFKVRVRYEPEPPSATFGSPGVMEEARDDGEHEDYAIGDVDAALSRAAVTLEAEYATPTQHHNPIELFTTTCAWAGRQLTIWEPSQFVYGLRGTVAAQLGIEPGDVRVVSKFVGGAFGSKGGATARTAWIAVAARRLGRPVKLVATRDQGFTIATYRAETRHRIRLGASADGTLLAFSHDGWELTSRPSTYNVSGTESTARAYACPNIHTRRADRARRPEHAGLHARTAGHALHVPAGMRDGRAGAEAGDGPDRAAPAQPAGARSHDRPGVLEPAPDGVPGPGGRPVRVEAAGPPLRADAGRRLADRLRLCRRVVPVQHRGLGRAGHPASGRACAGAPGRLRHRHGCLHRGRDRRVGPAGRADRAGGRGAGRHRAAAGSAGCRVEPYGEQSRTRWPWPARTCACGWPVPQPR